MIVVDASVTLAFLLPDEHDPKAVRAFADANEQGAVVPPHWLTEVLNATRMAERRGRLSISELDELIDDVLALEFEIETQPTVVGVHAVLDLSRSHSLTVYDASYLELARRRRCPLATLDAKLADAARAVGVPLAG